MECKRSPSGISVREGGNEVYRINERNGHWVACDHYGNGIGDNIALVMHVEPGLKFADAVYRLHGAPALVAAPIPKAQPKSQAPFVMPPHTSVDRKRGLEYLKGRGIDADTIAEAEKAGFLSYADKAVLFVGRDLVGTPMAATRRAATPDDRIQKMDLAGTDKRFVGVLPGTGSKAYIVDGGVDALALHAYAKRHGKPTPTVYVTGGVGNVTWLDRESVKAQLRKHSEIRIAGENERDAHTQLSTDALRNATAQRIEAITGKLPRIVTPSRAQGKDMADFNVWDIARDRAAVSEKERAAQAAQAQAIKDEGARRIKDLNKLKMAHIEISAQLVGYRSTTAIQKAGGDPSKVDWQEVDDIVTRDAIVKYGAKPDVVAQSLVKHSPGRADPATHVQAAQRVAEVAPQLQEQRRQDREEQQQDQQHER